MNVRAAHRSKLVHTHISINTHLGRLNILLHSLPHDLHRLVHLGKLVAHVLCRCSLSILNSPRRAKPTHAFRESTSVVAAWRLAAVVDYDGTNGDGRHNGDMVDIAVNGEGSRVGLSSGCEGSGGYLR